MFTHLLSKSFNEAYTCPHWQRLCMMHLMLFIQMTPGVLFHFHWVNLLMVASEYTGLKPKQMDLLIAIKLELWLRVMLKNMVLTKMKHLPSC